jgi:hypothetical protein
MPAAPLALANPPKALLALFGMLCITILMLADAIPSEAGTGMLGAIVGYAIGNGIAARDGVPVSPIIGTKE